MVSDPSREPGPGGGSASPGGRGLGARSDGTGRYRIVLPVGSDFDSTLETLEAILRHAAAPDALLLAGDGETLAAISAQGPRRQVEVVEIGGQTSSVPLLRSVLEATAGDDLLWVAPGLEVVPLFDLRLAWSARKAPEIAALSPLCDSAEVRALATSEGSRPDLYELDRQVSCLGGHAVVDAPSLLAGCFLLRRAAWDGLDPDELTDGDTLSAALRRRGRPLGLATHVVVGGCSGFQGRPSEAPGAPFLASLPMAALAERALGPASRARGGTPVRRKARPRVLHMSHSLGGGLERWVRLFAASDESVESWVLRSTGTPGRFGSELWLHDDPRDPRPRRTWKLASPIPATAIHHLGYRQVVEEILHELGIDAVIVSSLIGHSLDALRTRAPTAFVCHDYFPFCPALHIHFGGICQSCGDDRLQRCREDNALVNLFPGRDASEWLVLRQGFFAALLDRRIPVVVPSESVERHYRRLAPDLAAARFQLIEHAVEGERLAAVREARRDREAASVRRPLRAVILGRLTATKGAALLPGLVAAVGARVELSLVGCGAVWSGESPGGEVIREYDPAELPGILTRIDPDLVVLPSIVPETFSFTLGECFAAGIPPLATRVGSFEDRIVDGVSGFLAAPTAEALGQRLRELAADPAPLAEIERHLASTPLRTVDQMVNEYAELLELPEHSPNAYFSRVAGRLPDAEGAAADAPREAWLPPRSPLGFQDFLAQVEAGTMHHVESTRRLRPWQRRAARGLSRMVFGIARRLARAL